jgi:hypothetical protein
VIRAERFGSQECGKNRQNEAAVEIGWRIGARGRALKARSSTLVGRPNCSRPFLHTFSDPKVANIEGTEERRKTSRKSCARNQACDLTMRPSCADSATFLTAISETPDQSAEKSQSVRAQSTFLLEWRSNSVIQIKR